MPSTGWSISSAARLDHWPCGRSIERIQRLLGSRLQAGHERFFVQTLLLREGPTTRDHALLDGAQAAVLLGDQLGPGLGGLQLALQLAVLVLKVTDLLPHLWGAGDLLLESEHFDGVRAVLPMPGRLDAPESV